MLFDSYGISEQGPLAGNDDSLLLEPGYGVFVVADGMGGRPGGAQASRVAVRAFMDVLHRAKPGNLTVPTVLWQAVAAANAAVRAIAQADPAMAGMGTTLSAAVLLETGGKIVHVGDSRIYRFARGRLEQLTEDHTLATELVARNYLTDEAAQTFPLRHVLSRAVGTQPEVDPDIEDLVLKPDDWLLLATDGLYKALPLRRLEEIIASAGVAGAQALCRTIMQTAFAAGPTDNLTVAVVRVVSRNREGGP